MKKLLKSTLFLLSITVTHPIGAASYTCQNQTDRYIGQVGKYLDLMQGDLDKKEHKLSEQEDNVRRALEDLEACLKGLHHTPFPSYRPLPCQKVVDDYLSDLLFYIDYVGAADQGFVWDQDSHSEFLSVTERVNLGWKEVESCFIKHGISLRDQDKRLLLDDPSEQINISTIQREASQ